MEYTVVSDEDGHSYIIPFGKRVEWESWLDLDEDHPNYQMAPVWADRIDGGNVIFKEYRIG